MGCRWPWEVPQCHRRVFLRVCETNSILRTVCTFSFPGKHLVQTAFDDLWGQSFSSAECHLGIDQPLSSVVGTFLFSYLRGHPLRLTVVKQRLAEGHTAKRRQDCVLLAYEIGQKWCLFLVFKLCRCLVQELTGTNTLTKQLQSGRIHE